MACIASIRAEGSTWWRVRTCFPSDGLHSPTRPQETLRRQLCQGTGRYGSWWDKGGLFLRRGTNRLGRPSRFADFMVDGVKCAPDGIRCDVDGNLWSASNAGRDVGYNGVTIGNLEVGRSAGFVFPRCAPISPSGGPKRNRLFMCASQSLYAGARKHPRGRPSLTSQRA